MSEIKGGSAGDHEMSIMCQMTSIVITTSATVKLFVADCYSPVLVCLFMFHYSFLSLNKRNEIELKFESS